MPKHGQDPRDPHLAAHPQRLQRRHDHVQRRAGAAAGRRRSPSTPSASPALLTLSAAAGVLRAHRAPDLPRSGQALDRRRLVGDDHRPALRPDPAARPAAVDGGGRRRHRASAWARRCSAASATTRSTRRWSAAPSCRPPFPVAMTSWIPGFGAGRFTSLPSSTLTLPFTAAGLRRDHRRHAAGAVEVRPRGDRDRRPGHGLHQRLDRRDLAPC